MFFFSFISHKECFGFSCLHCCGRRLGSADGWHSCSRRIMWTKHFQFETNKRSSLWRNRVVRRSGGWGCGGGGEASVRSDRLLPLLLARPPLLHLHLHLHTGANNSQLFWSRKWWHKLNHLLLRVQANIALKLTIFSRLDSPAPLCFGWMWPSQFQAWFSTYCSKLGQFCHSSYFAATFPIFLRSTWWFYTIHNNWSAKKRFQKREVWILLVLSSFNHLKVH